MSMDTSVASAFWMTIRSKLCGRNSCNCPTPHIQATSFFTSITRTSPAIRTRFYSTHSEHGGSRRDFTICSGIRRSEEHTSELQSRRDLVCRLLLEKKKKKTI